MVAAGTPREIFTQVEALTRSSIDPPVLTELFARLRKKGLDVPMPVNVEQAVEELTRFLKA